MKEAQLKGNELEALRVLVQYLQDSIPEKVKTIALFGSKARGDSHFDSDIDVIVIVDHDDRDMRNTILTQAARISLNYDVLLSLRVIGEARWKQMRGFTLYRNVIHDAAGLAILEGELSFEEPVLL